AMAGVLPLRALLFPEEALDVASSVQYVHDVDAARNLDVEDEVVADRQAAKARGEVIPRASDPRRLGQALKPPPEGRDPARRCRAAASFGDVRADLSEVFLRRPRDAVAAHRRRLAFASSWFSRRSWSKNSSPSTTSPRSDAW